TLNWSYDLLDRPEQLLVGRLGVFSGGWTRDAAEAICGTDRVDAPAMDNSLLSLVDNSLVSSSARDDAELRFDMLQTVREYALFRLIESGDLADIRGRHLAWYRSLADDAEPELVGPRQAAWVRRLEAEVANVRAAMSWSLEGGNLEAGLRIA